MFYYGAKIRIIIGDKKKNALFYFGNPLKKQVTEVKSAIILEVLPAKNAFVQRLHKVFPMLGFSEILAISLPSVKPSQKC